MSHFSYAVQYVLDNEGVFSNDRYDAGGMTRYGITHGTLAAYQQRTGRLRGVHISALSRFQAVEIYKAMYWRFDDVKSRMLATKLFDMTVNYGLNPAVEIAQKAVNFTLGWDELTVDGLWGPRTQQAINALGANAEDRLRLFKAIVLFSADKYIRIVFANKTQVTFIDGWLSRAVRRPLN